MSPAALLADLSAASIRLHLEGDRLRFHGPAGAYTPELRARVAEHRAAVISDLRAELDRQFQRLEDIADRWDRGCGFLVERPDLEPAIYRRFCELAAEAYDVILAIETIAPDHPALATMVERIVTADERNAREAT